MNKVLFLTFFIITCSSTSIAVGQYCKFKTDKCDSDGCCSQVSKKSDAVSSTHHGGDPVSSSTGICVAKNSAEGVAVTSPKATV
jgi:hypothetical protein